MKKLIALMLACLLLGLTACSASVKVSVPAEQTQEQTQSAPTSEKTVVEAASLDELNKEFGCKLAAPNAGVIDISYKMIADGALAIAEYRFSMAKEECALRFSPDITKDISDVTVSGKPAFPNPPTGDVEYAESEQFSVMRWLTQEGQYCFIAPKGGAINDEVFLNAADNLRTLTAGGASEEEKSAKYQEMAGDYQDITSQRAVATVTAEADCAKIVVSWGSSAKETRTWTLTGRFAPDGMLQYEDEKVEDHIFDDNGTETVKVISENGTGFFEYANGNLYWTGAADLECSKCIFEKIKQVRT